MGGFTTQSPAASSTAEPTTPARIDMEKWAPADRDKYFLSGEMPEPAKPDPPTGTEAKPEDNAGAQPVEKATDGTGEKEPSGAEARIKELLAEVKGLKAKLEAPPATDPKSEPKTAKPAEDAKPVKPVQKDFETWEAYEEARDAHTEELSAWQSRKAIREFQAQQTANQEQAKVDQINERIQQSWRQRVDAVKAKPEYADFEKVATDKVPINRAADAFILDSAHGAEIFYHLGKNPAEATRIAGLSPIDTMRELVAIESQFKGGSQPKGGTPPKKESKPLSPPETVIDGRQVDNSDPVAAAVRNGDVATFMRLENERELASRR